MEDQGDGPPARARSPGRVETASNHVHFDTASVSTDNASRSTSAMTSPLSADFRNPAVTEQPVPKFPALHNDLPSGAGSSRQPSVGAEEEEDDDESIARPFQRGTSPSLETKRNKTAVYEKVGDIGVCRMHKYTLYETATRYYFVGQDIMETRFRILKIDRTSDVGNLNISEDEIVYTKKEMDQILNTIEDGNKSTGGIKIRTVTWGIIGFIRFTGVYYMLVVTKRSQVAMIGGHFTYAIDKTELIPLTTGSSSRFKPEARNAEEARFIGILNNLDLTRSFYFSPSYDITRTLQHNITAERDALAKGEPYPHEIDYNAMFVWNSYLLQPAVAALKKTYDWCMPLIHGYIDQSGKSL